MSDTEGIHRIDTDFFGRTNSLYLLVGESRTLLIDTGVESTPVEWLAPFMATTAIRGVDLVLNTHADLDHTGGNAVVGSMFPSSVQMCHELDRAWVDDVDALIEERYDEFAGYGMPEADATKEFLRGMATARPSSIGLTGGEHLHLSADWHVEVLHVPGHSRGHLAIWDPRSQAVIIGDAVLADGLYLTDGTPAFAPTYRYVESYTSTIDRLRALNPRTLYTSHYPTLVGDAISEFFDRSHDFVRELEGSLVEQLSTATTPHHLPALVAGCARAIGAWDDAGSLSLKYPILGHLERLVASGSVRVTDEQGYRGFVSQ